MPAALAGALERGLPGSLALGALLGRSYVFEGATLGGAVLASRLAEVPALAGEPFAYLRCYGDQLGPRWKAYGATMNRLLAAPGTLDAAIAQATATFTEVGRAFEEAWAAAGRCRRAVGLRALARQ